MYLPEHIGFKAAEPGNKLRCVPCKNKKIPTSDGILFGYESNKKN